jgi:uncharacterized lipoprotein YbaY
MAVYKNINPAGDVELVLPQQDDTDGTVLSRQRVLFVGAGETVEVSDVEESLIADQPSNWLKIESAKGASK